MGWLIALVILVLLALLPLGVTARYDADGAVVTLLAGPVPFRLNPKKKKEKKPKQKKEKSKGKPGAAAAGQQKKEKKGGSWKEFIPLVQTVLEFLNDFRRKMRIDRLDLKLIMAGDDPCDLAINYGRANAALGNLWPMLERCFLIKKRNVEIECDFQASEIVVIAHAKATITLGRLLVLVVRYGIRLIRQYLTIQKSRKGGASK